MTSKDIPVLNILGRKGRSTCLIVLATLLAFTLFGGAILLSSLRKGLKNLELRLGADVIVVPYEARTKSSADTILQQGNRTQYYMNRGILETLSKVEGVAQISAQTYLSTLSASCCSVSLQIIGFDPESDFTVQPWASKTFSGTLQKDQILIGSNVARPADNILHFYGIPCTVVAQLSDTGTGLDNAVYTNMETLAHLAEGQKNTGIQSLIPLNVQRDISSVYIKTAEGYSAEEIANYINIHVKKVVAVRTKSMTSAIAGSMAGLSKTIAGFLVLIWILCTAFIAVVFSLVMQERKKEFAILRTLGTSRQKLSKLIIAESVIQNTVGAVCGILLACIIIIPFQILIKELIALPFMLPSVWVTLLAAVVAFAVTVLSGSISAATSAKKISKADTALTLRQEN